MTYFIDYDSGAFRPPEEFYLLSIQQGEVFTVHMDDNLKHDSNALLAYGTDRYFISCCGCVNGIICLTLLYRKKITIDDSFLALWNPAIRKFKTLAYPNEPGLLYPNHFQILGFGFDLSLSFKILGGYNVLRGNESNDAYHLIYSLKSNSWKQINNPPADICCLPMVHSDGYLNGVYYWTIDLHQKSGCPRQFVIVSFNFTSEAFKVCDLPHDAISLVLESYPYHNKIALYKERLALVISHKVQDEALYSIRIWVVTQFDDCGVPLSWQHLFNIGPTPAKSGLLVNSILMNGDLQLTFVFPLLYPNGEECEGSLDEQVYLYKLSKGEFKKFDFPWLTWFRYVESLFPLSNRLVQT